MQAVFEQGWPWEPEPAARAWLSPAPAMGTPAASRAKPADAEVLCEPGCGALSIPAVNHPTFPWCPHPSEAAAKWGSVHGTWMSNCNGAVRHGVPNRPRTKQPRDISFWCRKVSHISVAWGRLGPVFPGTAEANHPPVALREVKVGLERCCCRQDGRSHFCKPDPRTGPFQLPVREIFQPNQLFFNRAG